MALSKNFVLALCATKKISINVLALCAVNQKVSETIQKHDNVQECQKSELHFHASSVILFIGYTPNLFKKYCCVTNTTKGPKSKTTGNAETG